MCPRTKEQFELIRQGSKQKILDAALEVFAKYGYHSSSVSAIAQKAGIAKGLMYNYFKSKEDVLYKLMIDMIVTYVKEIFPLDQEKQLKKKDMENLINRTIDFVLEKPDYWKLYMGIFVQPDVMPKLITKMWEAFDPLMSIITGYFKSKGHKDPESMTRYFVAVIDGVQLHIMMDPEYFPAEKIKKLLIKQFV